MRLFAVPMLLALAACAQTPVRDASYPSNWPELRTGPCDEVSGTFRNAAVASSAPERTTDAPLLVPLLRRGALVASDAGSELGATASVSLAGASSDAASARVAHRRASEPLSFGAIWRCGSDGAVVVSFPSFDGGGESSTADRSAVTVALSKATDGSLVARWTMKSRGTSLVVVPYELEAVYWLRFSQVP